MTVQPEEKQMEKLSNILRQPGFHLWLFSFCLFLFSWPILKIPEKPLNETLFIYLFVVWSIIVLLLFLIAASLGREKGRPD